MKIRLPEALCLLAIAALASNSLAHPDCIEGQLCPIDQVGPFIDGDPEGPDAPDDPSDPSDPVDPSDPEPPRTPTIKWASFADVDAAQDRNVIDYFGDELIVRRFGSTAAWGDTLAPSNDTFAADTRLPGVEAAEFTTLAARGDSPAVDYAVMLRFGTGAMSRDDVLSIGQLFRDSASSLTSARIEASYQGQAVELSSFEIFNLDLESQTTGAAFLADLGYDLNTGELIPTENSNNSDFLMLRPLEGVLVDKLDIFINSSRPESPFTDRIDIALGTFVVPAPGAVVPMLGGFLMVSRRRRNSH